MKESHIIETLLGEFRDKLDRITDLVPRKAQFPNAPDKVKVAIGMRRAGKTYFLYQHIFKLLAEGVPLSRILYINFEDDRLFPIDEKKLADLIASFFEIYPQNHDEKCFLFLDEIQNVENWPVVIRRFHDSKNIEIFLSGSSAKLLSKEIATNLRGRSLSTEIWPYSFNEYLFAKKINVDQSLYDQKTIDQLKRYFHQYLSVGGFPEVIAYDEDVRQQTLQEYIDIVLFRDIIERHKIKNPSVVKYMILTLLHNVSSNFTVHKFYNDLKSRGYVTGKDALYEYLNHIEDAYLIFPIQIYDRSIRKRETNPKKIYSIDPGLVRATTLDYESDLGKLFENVIYLDLRRMGYRVDYYLTSDRYEIDFVVQGPKSQTMLIQVVWDADNPETLHREKRALEAASEELGVEGIILTLEGYLRGELSKLSL